MSWRVTISGHIGSRETEKAVVDSLRSLVKNLNGDGTVFADYARVVTAYGGDIDLLAPDEDVFEYAVPVKATDETSGRLETENIKDTDKVVVGSELYGKDDDDEDDEDDDKPKEVHATSKPKEPVKSTASPTKTSPLKPAGK